MSLAALMAEPAATCAKMLSPTSVLVMALPNCWPICAPVMVPANRSIPYQVVLAMPSAKFVNEKSPAWVRVGDQNRRAD